MAEVKPLTVDNLGIKTSRRYAEDQAKLDPKLLQDARTVPLRTEVSVLKPYTPTELGEYLEPNKITSWASFSPPPDYFSEGNTLFSYTLIPSLGGYEKQEADMDKLEDLEKVKGQNPQEEKERQTLLSLFKTISRFDKDLSTIKARLNQYHRG